VAGSENAAKYFPDQAKSLRATADKNPIAMTPTALKGREKLIINSDMADYVAAPEGGIREAGTEAAPVAQEEVKMDTAETATDTQAGTTEEQSGDESDKETSSEESIEDSEKKPERHSEGLGREDRSFGSVAGNPKPQGRGRE
jgi:hypothetical protein